MRHSGANRCVISFTRQNDSNYLLQVQDNGRKRQKIVAGNGLKGIKERIAEAGGTTQWQSGPEGFLLEIRLPVARVDMEQSNASAAS